MALKSEGMGIERYSPLVLVPFVFLATLLIQFYTLPNADIMWLLHGVHEMREGAVLYKDIREPDPPLIFWLYGPSVLLARIFEWDPATILKMMTVAVIAPVTFICFRVLKSSHVWSVQEQKTLTLAIAAVLLLAPDGFMTFAQREHIVVIFTMPYIMLNLPSVSQQAFPVLLRASIGVLAALGMCLKPHFFTLWLVVLGQRLYRTRSWRSLVTMEDAAIGSTLLWFITVLLMFYREYFNWVGILLHVWGANAYLGETAFDKALWFAGLALAGSALAWKFGLLRYVKDDPYQGDLSYLRWVAVAAFAEALLQFKTWAYISYPFIAFGLLALCASILRRYTKDIWAVLVVLWAFFPTTPTNDRRQLGAISEYEAVMEHLAPYQNARDLYMVNLVPAMPQFYRMDSPLRWSSKFLLSYVMLAATMEQSPYTVFPVQRVRPGKEWLEAWVLQAFADDLGKKKPELILFEKRWDVRYPEESLDSRAWFATHEGLSQILKGYSLRKEFEVCANPDRPQLPKRCSYWLYTRETE